MTEGWVCSVFVMRMLWLRGNLNPEELRVTMKKSSAEDVSSPDVQMPCADEDSDESDPRVEMPPQVRHLDASTFKMEFDAVLSISNLGSRGETTTAGCALMVLRVAKHVLILKPNRLCCAVGILVSITIIR